MEASSKGSQKQPLGELGSVEKIQLLLEDLKTGNTNMMSPAEV